MKVNELTDLLSKANPEAELIIKSSSGLQFDIDVDQVMTQCFDDKIKKADKFDIRIK